MLSLWSNLCCITLVLTFGILSKFMNLTVLLNLTNTLLLCAYCTACYDIVYNDDLTWLYDFGFIAATAI
jgi:hypothetical protein